MRYLTICAAGLLLSSCGSYTTPAAVKFDDGTALLGTTTAAISGGHFQLSTPDKSLICGGTYDALDMKTVITIPVSCNDGRYGSAVITRNRDGLGGRGYVTTSDGKRGVVAFGNNAGAILTASPRSSVVTSPSYRQSSSYSGRSSSSYRTYHLGPRGGCYYFNGSGNKQYVDRSFCR